MRTTALLLTFAATLLTACTTHVHRPRPAHVLEAEHGKRTVVVVHTRPAAGRHCWQHGAHWHCRRR